MKYYLTSLEFERRWICFGYTDLSETEKKNDDRLVFASREDAEYALHLATVIVTEVYEKERKGEHVRIMMDTLAGIIRTMTVCEVHEKIWQ